MAKSNEKDAHPASTRILVLLISVLLLVGIAVSLTKTKNLWSVRLTGRSVCMRKVRKTRTTHKTLRIGCGGGGRAMPVPLSHIKELSKNFASFMKRNVLPVKAGGPGDIYPRGMFDYDVGVDQANYYSFGGQVGVQGG